MGMFHVHFGGTESLSEGDKEYIVRIMEVMPKKIGCLYFPVVVMPERKVVAYKAVRNNVLPEGCFYGNCSDCVYADRSDWRDGEVYCLCEKGWTHGYNRPSDRNGCAYYEER